MKEYKITEHPLFATSIWSFRVPSYGILNQKLKEYIYDMQKKSPEGVKRSNGKGWHSPDFNLNDKTVSLFCEKVDPIINSIVDALRWDTKNYRLNYGNIWTIINNKYSYNNVHHHGDSLLSLAYYVKTPKDGGGDIYFQDPRYSSISRRPPLIDRNKDCTFGGKTHANHSYHITPEEGILIIFPSWMYHGVTQNLSDEDRIVISANINMYPKAGWDMNKSNSYTPN